MTPSCGVREGSCGHDVILEVHWVSIRCIRKSTVHPGAEPRGSGEVGVARAEAPEHAAARRTLGSVRPHADPIVR